MYNNLMLILLALTIKSLITNFNKKLLVLLNLEVAMIWIVLLMSESFSFTGYNIYILFLMMVFMVMDSVYGISVLLSTSRNSSIYSLVYKI